MPYSKAQDPTKPMMAAVNGRLETTVSTVTSVSTPADHVWFKSIPQNANVGFPRALFRIETGPSSLLHNKDTQGIEATVDVIFWSRDRMEVVELNTDAQERLTDRTNRLSPTGWTVIDEELTTSFERDEEREDQPNVFGRVLRVSYHLKP